MHLNAGPITVTFAAPIADGTTIAVCFDAGCSPATIVVSDNPLAPCPGPFHYDEVVVRGGSTSP